MTTRADVLTALFGLVAGATAWGTSGQKLIFWDSVVDQPAVFTRYVRDRYPVREVRGLFPARMVMWVEIWIYSRQPDVDAPGSDAITPLMDLVIAALEPQGAATAQNLGLPGVVSHAWVEGDVIVDDGSPANPEQQIAMVPVRIMIEGLLR